MQKISLTLKERAKYTMRRKKKTDVYTLVSQKTDDEKIKSKLHHLLFKITSILAI